MMIDELEVDAGPLARWQVHWCDPRREVSWYAADPVLAGLPTLAEWAHAHGTQPGQPVLLRADGWSVPEVNGRHAHGLTYGTVRWTGPRWPPWSA
ncbi:hypothetical protein, partial [Streptomyces griseoruber]|uniref:hypothetical protein n=1 Tax=Streptomyces griseoruber TaxID=1943 RepID=UPI0019820410